MSELPSELPDGLSLFYPLAQMALLIALRIQAGDGEPLRTTIDKVRKRLVYATKIGVLETTRAGLYYLPKTAIWAQEKWPGKFGDLYAERSGSGSVTLPFGGKGWGFSIPGDLPRCQEALRNAERDNYNLRESLKTAQEEMERLKPLAERYEEICRKNTQSAELPRKGRV